MRFGVPSDSTEEDDYTSEASYVFTSDEESDGSISFRKASGQNAALRQQNEYSSDEDAINSEDEVELIGGLSPNRKSADKTRYRDPQKKKRSWKKVLLNQAESSNAPWKRVQATMLSLNPPVIHQDGSNAYEGWLKSSEEQAMRDGRRIAHERQDEIERLSLTARQSIRQREQARLDREEEDMRKLLEAMAIKQTKEEADVAKQFAEREKKLWADIDAALKEVERQEAQLRQAAQETARRLQAEEAERAAKAEQQAKERKAEEEKRVRTQAEEEKKRKEDEAQKEVQRAKDAQNAATAQQEKEQAERKSKEKTRLITEWSDWVEKQKWMKREVIEPMKRDTETLRPMKKIMRLIGRSVGQLVNSQEGIIRVASDMHTALCQHLPSPPSLSSPLPMSNAPRPYLYLLSHMSKAILKQAESEVSAKPDAAYPLARVVVLLLLQGHTSFGEILFARFVKKCPWVVPFYPSRMEGQSREEYEKSTGRGTDESAADYIGRMNGILTLYLAIVQTPLPSLFQALNSTPTADQLANVITPPLRFPAAWSWLAHALRDPLPALFPTATLITTWVEMVGAEVIRVYGRGQVMKIFQAIKEEGLDGGKIKGDSESARNQLRMVLEQADRLSAPTARHWT